MYKRQWQLSRAADLEQLWEAMTADSRDFEDERLPYWTELWPDVYKRQVGNVTISLAMGLVLGVPLAVAQVYGGPWLRRMVALYVWFFRGVPILVLLFLCYGFFISLGLPADPFLICCLVLGCTSTAYQSQIFRGAIESLPLSLIHI